MEEVHGKRPEAAVYDMLHVLESSVLEAHEAALGAHTNGTADDQWRIGVCVLLYLFRQLSVCVFRSFVHVARCLYTWVSPRPRCAALARGWFHTCTGTDLHYGTKGEINGAFVAQCKSKDAWRAFDAKQRVLATTCKDL